MFVITRGKGFRIEFENGWKISVQFGYGCYCENRDNLGGREDYGWPAGAAKDVSSKDAEIAVIDPDGNFCPSALLDNDDVEGWCSAERVLQVMNWVAQQKREVDAEGGDPEKLKPHQEEDDDDAR